ncbi:hypothetical protein [Azospirillum sp.]|uniref:hypothetical protein n=1 Tax=Azospirillum sp. TaxID=34012 RepID=UPI002D3ADA98|nr:hypothetical protein [Azospirillum sp.]HYD66112.1 hypothetical protein [Azospirillum sp.]
MQLAALSEAERIEISQDGRVKLGMLKEPMPDQVSLRDDFAGIVRLIDLIQSDAVILERLGKLSQLPVPATDAASIEEADDE